jgi:hypothetical protein
MDGAQTLNSLIPKIGFEGNKAKKWGHQDISTKKTLENRPRVLLYLLLLFVGVRCQKHKCQIL